MVSLRVGRGKKGAQDARKRGAGQRQDIANDGRKTLNDSRCPASIILTVIGLSGFQRIICMWRSSLRHQNHHEYGRAISVE
jgi:hypothetical protein